MLVLTKLTHVKKSLPSSVVTDCCEVVVMLPSVLPVRALYRYSISTGKSFGWL